MTIGLPVLGGIRYVEWAVRSIFAQTESDWELIIVCDGAAKEIVNRMHQIEDARVTVRAHSKNRGLPTRLNEIAAIAKGQYVARMDSDDVMHPQRLSIQLDYMDSIPSVEVLGSGSFLMDEQNMVCGKYKEPSLPTGRAGFLNSGVLSHPTVVLRTKWALDNPYDPSRVRTEDKELWLRASGYSHYDKLQDNLLFCRVPRDLSVEKQAVTARRDRRLLLELGPSVAPCCHVFSKWFESLLKQHLFWLGCKVGQSARIHKAKCTTLPEGELAKARECLDWAIETSVPGWEE